MRTSCSQIVVGKTLMRREDADGRRQKDADGIFADYRHRFLLSARL